MFPGFPLITQANKRHFCVLGNMAEVVPPAERAFVLLTWVGCFTEKGKERSPGRVSRAQHLRGAPGLSHNSLPLLDRLTGKGKRLLGGFQSSGWPSQCAGWWEPQWTARMRKWPCPAHPWSPSIWASVESGGGDLQVATTSTPDMGGRQGPAIRMPSGQRLSSGTFAPVTTLQAFRIPFCSFLHT